MRTFKGGVHPREMKEATCKKEIVDLDAPQEMVYPLSQHIGAPAKPCVKVGDMVCMGQLIGEADGMMSANIHASVSGKVKAIEKRLHPNGAMVPAIVIENDGCDTYMPPFDVPANKYQDLTRETLADMIKNAGIVGMGGAAFPTHVKLSPPPDAKIDYIIINGSECEPYLTSDHRAMLETPAEIVGGLKILLHAFGLHSGYIGIEDNKKDAIELLQLYAEKEKEKKIHIVPMKTKYPQGAEKQLIQVVTGRKVGPGKLPYQVGCIVLNIDTCCSILRAFRDRMPVIQRIVTLGGDALKNPMNVRVRVGTPFSYVLEQSGGFVEEPKKVLMGGPMMGTAVPNLTVPVIKGTSGILCLGERKARLEKEGACIRCAKCVYACPMNLLPNVLDSAARRNDFDMLKKQNISDCIECGSCAFICPARRRQVQQIRVAKVKMRSLQEKAK